MAEIKDIVLIYMEDAPVSFARIEDIVPDHKKDWYQIRLLMLQIPLQVVTWILKADYINGDVFSMNGKSMRLEKVVAPVVANEHNDAPETPPENGNDSESLKSDDSSEKNQGNIISFSKRKNHKNGQES
ncbi:hypothetical protein DO021_00570 [Desulfobacter hydrogenophilus]|uniref:Uncharacterized protein n=1 Tax=Desulfobacter hydrogenophilus TaxID=2291 RepID=A0A328FKF6_9BACT|nr:hypothetical protein [Desulfobacter hydrogenophilus]NDY73376.1 hypothetical protein [Desulfobacter hydrogenophilus]QBH12968.1 hypothetical protein EYB58_08585 [Desulfobacter hydrogenophilus]RAM03952.1 hypothetical protein DO021_00570 [Desulfobacter hydrogenophilus]